MVLHTYNPTYLGGCKKLVRPPSQPMHQAWWFTSVVPAARETSSVQVGPCKMRDPIQKITKAARCWCLVPVILPTQEAEIRRITFRSQPRQIVLKTLSQKYPTQNRLME
jgi:hypothetical protein